MKEFQIKVYEWLIKCFGSTIANDRKERNHRFIEESLELVQSLGCTKEEVLMIVDYTYSRPIGKPQQEVGGVIVTLCALCTPNGLRLEACAEAELVRIHNKIELIRQKQATKPKDSPLPE